MSDPVVTVKQGDLRGVKIESVTGGSYIAFKGIPYARPPVGDFRFRDPQPPQSWTGVRDASEEGPKCGQLDMITKTIIGDDDCLHLNVATTSLTGSRPVMVWIHGGAFMLGDGGFDMYRPDYMMGSDIVYVGINYRVGVLGFLQLDHEVAPGNMGLKDQVAALKWVKENISQFGGDPNNVTIFGESAGGASVHYLLLSPLAKGLFHKAIMQSAVALNPFAFHSGTVDVGHRYVAALGKNTTDPNEIVDYLRTIPVHRLIEVQENMLTPEAREWNFIPFTTHLPSNEGKSNNLAMKSHLSDILLQTSCENHYFFQERVNLVLPFGPSVDDRSVEPFLPRPLEDLVAKGFDVPVIIGHTSHEGIIFLMGLQDEAYTKLDENFELTVPRNLVAKAPSKVQEIAREIRKFYFGKNRITKDMVDEYVQCCGDIHFVLGIHEVVEIQQKKKLPTYFYRFSYDSPHSIAKAFFQLEVKGAMHAEELQYMFFAEKFRDHITMEPGSTEDILRQRFVRMWTDFAKTGNPTPKIDDLITEKWESVTETKKNYLEIAEELSAAVNPCKDMWEAWKRIYAMVGDQ